MSRHVEMSFFNLSRKSRLSRLTFFWRRDRDLDRDLDKNQEILIFRVVETVETWFLNCRDWLFFGVEIEISIEITSRQIETPNLKNFPFWLSLIIFTRSSFTSFLFLHSSVVYLCRLYFSLICSCFLFLSNFFQIPFSVFSFVCLLGSLGLSSSFLTLFGLSLVSFLVCLSRIFLGLSVSFFSSSVYWQQKCWRIFFLLLSHDLYSLPVQYLHDEARKIPQK